MYMYLGVHQPTPLPIKGGYQVNKNAINPKTNQDNVILFEDL